MSLKTPFSQVTQSELTRKIESIQLSGVKRFIKGKINLVRTVLNYGITAGLNVVNDVIRNYPSFKGNGGHPYISGNTRCLLTSNEFCFGDAFPRGCPSASCLLHGCRFALSQWNCGRAAAEYIGYQPPHPVAVSQMSDETYVA